MKRVSRSALAFLVLTGCSGRACSDDSASGQISAAALRPSSAASGTSPPNVSTPLAVIAPPAAWGTTALAHLPQGCAGAMRIQWRALAQQPLLASTLQRLVSGSSADAGASLEQRAFLAFLKDAKLDPLKDIEQVAVCVYPDVRKPLLVVAGALPDNLLKLMQAHAPPAERLTLEQHAGVAVLRRKQNYVLQAEDRALLLGSELPVLLAARQLGPAHAAYQVPEQGELALALREPLAGSLLNLLLGSGMAHRISRLTASFDFARGVLVLESEHPSAEEAELLKSALSGLTQPAAQLSDPTPNVREAGEAPMLGLLRTARFEVDGSRVKARLDVPAVWIGALLGRALTQSGAGAPASKMRTGLDQR